MSEHRARIEWRNDSDTLAYGTYTRDHSWSFHSHDVLASAAPEYLGAEARVNPEEAFVASLSSCHMLTFLAIAAKRKVIVDRYVDNAVGYLQTNENGKLAITRVVLHPEISFGGDSAVTQSDLTMAQTPPVPASIDEYIAAAAPAARPLLEEIRRVVREAAPEAEELISYRMPAFRQHGILIYFAAFKQHIGVFPPVAGDAKLQKALEPYAGPKGNLRFPMDRPMPYALIRRIVRLKLKQNLARASAKSTGHRIE